MSELGRWLLVMGLVAAAAGGVLLLVGRFGGGQLPGDLSWERGNVRVFAPLGTMLLLSIILTVVLNLVSRWWR